MSETEAKKDLEEMKEDQIDNPDTADKKKKKKKKNKNKEKEAARPKKKRRTPNNGTSTTSPTNTNTNVNQPPLPPTDIVPRQKWASINKTSFAKYRALMNGRLLKGLPPIAKPILTRVHPLTLMQCIAFITAACQYRPGKLRNYRLQGFVLKNLPVYTRDGKSTHCNIKPYPISLYLIHTVIIPC